MKNFSPVFPVGVTFERWVEAQIQTLPTIKVPLPSTEKYWHEWAAFLLFLNPSLQSRVPAPVRSLFPNDDDWKKWGNFFLNILITRR